MRLCEDVLCSTFAEGFRLDGGFKWESVWHFTHLLEDILHLLRVGEELLVLAVNLNGDNAPVFSLAGLYPGLKVFDHDRKVYQLADAYHRTRKSLLAVFGPLAATFTLFVAEHLVERLQEQPNNGSNSTADKSQDPVKPVLVAAFELVLELKTGSSYNGRIDGSPGRHREQAYKQTSNEVLVAVALFQK